MQYYGDIYRPPSEARSLILQLTIGCSHNKCTFCKMYKKKNFRIRSVEDFKKDLEDIPYYFEKTERIFLADGDALVVKQKNLVEVMKILKKRFPDCRRIGIYGSPKAIFTKSVDDLKELKELGLGMVYLGVESGSDKVLSMVKKGVDSSEMLKAGLRIKEAGISLSTTLISGLGGKRYTEEHTLESAKLMNAIQPDYLGLLSLMVEPGTEYYDDVNSGKIEILSPREILQETRLFVENLNLQNTVFRSNHASNYVSLRGTLDRDKNLILHEIDSSMDEIEEIAADKIRLF